MIKEALAYLVGLKENKTYEINGQTYSDHALSRIEEYIDRPDPMAVHSLDAIVQLIRHEAMRKPRYQSSPLLISIADYDSVEVYSDMDDLYKRDHLYYARQNEVDFRPGWRDYQAALIELRSIFIPNEGSEYLLQLLSQISRDDSVKTTDNGMTQTVAVKQGIALKGTETIRPRVTLQPFRTFREVPQPESEFIVRVDDNQRIALIEADGGIWKLEAKDYIKGYFLKNLAPEIEAGAVVVMV